MDHTTATLGNIRNEVLADSAQEYTSHRQPRPGADPLGLRGLPAERADLDAMWADMRDRVRSCGDQGIRSARLAAEIGLEPGRHAARPIRLLVAYGRVWLRDTDILGVPGDRYYWGPARLGLRPQVIRQARRMGRCYFFIATLLGKGSTATAAVQLVFDFMGHRPADSADPPPSDDLAALVASQGVTVADFLESAVTTLAETDDGRQMLRGLTRRHADILMPRQALADLANDLAALRARLLTAAEGAA